jgi:hypothetical protein
MGWGVGSRCGRFAGSMGHWAVQRHTQCPLLTPGAHTDESGPSRAAPGAHRSTQAPQLEKLGLRSKASVAATTTQPVNDAGDTVQESMLLFPAAATTMTFNASRALTCMCNNTGDNKWESERGEC